MKQLVCIFFLAVSALAQAPGQQSAQSATQSTTQPNAQRPAMRPIPPVGVEVPAADRTELENGLRRLKTAMDKVKDHPLLPDVMIYHEAVRYALQYNEFFKLEEVFKAKLLLQHGENLFVLRLTCSRASSLYLQHFYLSMSLNESRKGC